LALQFHVHADGIVQGKQQVVENMASAFDQRVVKAFGAELKEVEH
jgi:hypothetical protein